MPERVGRASYASVSPRECSRVDGVDYEQTDQRPIDRGFGTNAKLRRLDKMASGIRAVRPLQHRRLHAGGVPSYTNAPDR